MKKTNNPLIFSGSKYPKFAEDVANYLNLKVEDSGIEKFSNSETCVNLGCSVRGKNVFIFQTHSNPVNESIMEQAIIIDAAKRASAGHITAVCPILGYSRQDRKSKGREPISARLVVDILKVAGANRIVTIDLHSSQAQGFFDGPFDHLTAMPIIEDYIKKNYKKNSIMISPDAGRVKQTEKFANHLGLEMAIIHKYRNEKNKAQAATIIGDVRDKHCIINDDLIDTAGTICSAAKLLKKFGATKVSAIATHGIFSGNALKNLNSSEIDSITVTDTIPLPTNIPPGLKINVISITKLVGSSIMAIHNNGSVYDIFNGDNHL